MRSIFDTGGTGNPRRGCSIGRPWGRRSRWGHSRLTGDTGTHAHGRASSSSLLGSAESIGLESVCIQVVLIFNNKSVIVSMRENTDRHEAGGGIVEDLFLRPFAPSFCNW
jgi:hypothetical protein